MNKKTIITALLSLVTLTGWAQSTKTATVTGYSPALKDGTLVFASTGPCASVVDTVQAGHFVYTLPVEEFTESSLSFYGEGCPRMYLNIWFIILLRQLCLMNLLVRYLLRILDLI